MKCIRFSIVMAVAVLLISSVAAFGNLFGVDVSRYQGTVNWDSLNASTNFAMMQSTYGYSTDSQFSRNLSESRRVGMRRGFYHFCHPELGNTAVGEADYFVNTVGALQSGELL